MIIQHNAAEPLPLPGHPPNEWFRFEPKNDLKNKFAFCVVFRSKQPVLTIFPPFFVPNGTYERIKTFSDTLPLKAPVGAKNVFTKLIYTIPVQMRKLIQIH